MRSKTPKVGRPALPKSERRSSITPVRLSKQEREEFEKAAVKKGVKLSDWIREALNEAVKAQYND